MTSLILHILDCVHMLFYPVIKGEIMFPLKSVGEILWIHCIITLAVIWTTKQLQNLLKKLFPLQRSDHFIDLWAFFFFNEVSGRYLFAGYPVRKSTQCSCER